MLGDKKFYSKVISVLKRRAIFDMKIYGFSLLHGDMDTFKLFLKNMNPYMVEEGAKKHFKKKIRMPMLFNKKINESGG